jgi:hypothetical protein
VPQVLLGQRGLSGAPRSAAYLTLVAAGWLIVTGAVAAALRGWTRPDWVPAVVLVGQAVALYGESVIAGGVALARYAVAPGLLILAALALLVRPPRPATGWRGRAPMIALLTLVAVVCAVNLRVANPRAAGPSWRASVRAARTACVGHRADETVLVAVSPLVKGTTAALPCGYLRR